VSRDGREIELLGLVAGFAVWSLGFVLLYGAHGLACSLGVRPGAGDGAARAVLAGLFALLLAANLWLVLRLRRRLRQAPGGPVRFVRLASLALATAAAGASLWTGFPVLTLGICR